MIQRAELSPELAQRWRYRGNTPSPEQWAQILWQGTLAQYLVVDRRTDEAVGLCMAYRPNFQDGHAYLGAAKFRERDRSPRMIAGTAMFVEYVFANWDFNKLYLEVPEFNFPQVARGIGRLFELEGRFREHSYYDGRHWDQLVLALYRDTWMKTRASYLAMEGLDQWRDQSSDGYAARPYREAPEFASNRDDI